ncbi:hypothetical protein HS1genome_2164 [Sulfodiicoccus acidiphilus]|uniref:TIGR00304 family protein n=1 Tax=Sulfodiicoccus acidiphilus TaxID=1670455 RepID=A0A348B6H3_9CREN|nr:DUF131 domain-containing protein [Sulfodiicoccus acidiphilus]BBD73775.1 hypothetical protein HS1genome_2164 [Sulfodiicoccus acidiphilus]GGT98262.1 hypothetical protein GCM10007116_14800 [Sulfodiicoccus acidiphilus]
MELLELGFVVVFLGFLLIFAGVIYEIIKASRRSEGRSEESEGKGEFGGVIFVGPVPIVFGSSKRMAKWMIVAAAIITAVLVFVFLIQII